MAFSTLAASGAFLLALGAITVGSEMRGESSASAVQAAQVACVNAQENAPAAAQHCAGFVHSSYVPAGSWTLFAQAFPR